MEQASTQGVYSASPSAVGAQFSILALIFHNSSTCCRRVSPVSAPCSWEISFTCEKQVDAVEALRPVSLLAAYFMAISPRSNHSPAENSFHAYMLPTFSGLWGVQSAYSASPSLGSGFPAAASARIFKMKSHVSVS